MGPQLRLELAGQEGPQKLRPLAGTGYLQPVTNTSLLETGCHSKGPLINKELPGREGAPLTSVLYKNRGQLG